MPAGAVPSESDLEEEHEEGKMTKKKMMQIMGKVVMMRIRWMR